MSLEEFHEISIQVPWGHIAGRWYGDQMQRPLIALHGWLDNCGTFARIAPLLMAHTSLLCIDLPGHGYSSHLPNGIIYHNLEYVRTLLHLMKAYKWKQISLMAHSMGGNVAFTFAGLYPDRVDMVVSLDIIRHKFFPPHMEPVVIQHVIERSIIDNERRMGEIAMNEPPSYTYDECVRLLYEGSEHSVDMENCKYLLERNITKSRKYPDKYYFSRDGRLKYLLSFNLPHEMAKRMIVRMSRNEVPYLVIKGGASTNLSAATISELLPVFEKYNKNFELRVVDGATHHLHLNNPREVADIIIDFWRSKNWPSNCDNGRNNLIEASEEIQSKL